ncbi:MAG TPA: uroporphyrinogen-III synthase [Rhodothermales bacterium]|nr:uroporphyrinogen-III synthase [Rhodothermales bacterium]
MHSRPLIWLFKEPSRDDRFARAFESSGIDTRYIPVLHTELIEPPDSVPPVDGVVVTSARAVEAIEDWRLLGELKALRWFSVGPATAARLEELGIPVHDGHSGTAAALARMIVDAGARRVLFLAGDPHRDELPMHLREAGVDVVTEIVYRTNPGPLILPADDLLPDWAVFFSPRGVSIVMEETDIDWDQVAVAAVGPTTASTVRAMGLEPRAVAESPTPSALLTAILSADWN